MNHRCMVLALAKSLILSLSLIINPALASLVTWNLKDVTPFDSGQSASGYFTVEQEQETVVDWNITITGGINPNLTNITFSDNDENCARDCLRIFFDDSYPPAQIALSLKNSLNAENIFNGLFFLIVGSKDELFFPDDNSELIVVSQSSGPAKEERTEISLDLYVEDRNSIRGLDFDLLIGVNSNAKIVSDFIADVPETGTVALLGLGLSVLGIYRRKRSTPR